VIPFPRNDEPKSTNLNSTSTLREVKRRSNRIARQPTGNLLHFLYMPGFPLVLQNQARHCEEQGDEAISILGAAIP
ncbi:MAG TPA: hypothetical protein VLA15_05395, partial [Desulfurivibrionaceae bacterium]|nr:hypothetical protein [Desulfurivibrionaceae bacterium]